MSDAKGNQTLIKNNQNGDEEGRKIPRPGTTNSDKDVIPADTRGLTVTSLPPEVLNLIFGKVDSSKDLLNCWNTSSAWATALRSTDFYFKMSLPFLLPYLSRSDLLQCSSVSKSLNQAVDVCIQECEDFGNDIRLKSEQRIVLKLDSIGTRLNGNGLINFVNRFLLSTNNESKDKIPAVNPVAFRRVEATLWSRSRAEMRLSDGPFSVDGRNLLKCLDYCGHFIQYLHLGINDDENVGSIYKLKIIRSVLAQTPNLRVLQISIIDDCGRADENESDGEMEAVNSKNSWPSLEHLKVLKFGHYTDEEDYACVATAYAPQLLYLQFGHQLMEPIRSDAERFSCLQKIVYLFDDSWSAMEFGTFVQSSQCPLKHLTAVFYISLDVENAINGLQMAINATSATLETLVFRPRSKHPTDFNFDGTKLNKLRVPGLKAMELETFGYPSVEFLQNVCPALQQLTVTPSFPDRFVDIKLETGEIYRDLYSQHQFWNKLANIQSVNVRFDPQDASIDGIECMWGMEIPEEKGRKLFNRRGYEAKLAKDRAKENENR